MNIFGIMKHLMQICDTTLSHFSSPIIMATIKAIHKRIHEKLQHHKL